MQCVLCCSDSDPRVIVRGRGQVALAPSCRGSRVHRRNRTLRSLLTAAHTYSHNQSQITSVSDEPSQPTRTRGLAQPSRGSFEGDCRTRLGIDSRRHRDAGLSMSFYCPPPGDTSGQRLARNTPAGQICICRSRAGSPRFRGKPDATVIGMSAPEDQTNSGRKSESPAEGWSDRRSGFCRAATGRRGSAVAASGRPTSGPVPTTGRRPPRNPSRGDRQTGPVPALVPAGRPPVRRVRVPRDPGRRTVSSELPIRGGRYCPGSMRVTPDPVSPL